MAADTSAYAVLGLKPGAEAAEIERAYKALIKQFHPDREGGDAQRAAEINRAYRDLRKEREEEEWIFDGTDPFEPAPTAFPWASAAIVIAVGIVLLMLFTGPLGRTLGQLSGATASIRHAGGDAPAVDAPDIMDQPLDLASVGGGVSDAVRIAHSQDEMALASASRDCHHELRLKPALARLDRCAAFDDAVVQLQDRDPLRDQGPFSELAVTGRLMSAATMFSDDYLAIDSRLDRIRLRVELALAPPVPPPTPPPEPEAPAD
jgi:hypothetical protein